MPTSPANGGNEHSIGIHDAERTAITKRRKLTEGLDRLVFCVAFMEWAGNALGTLAFIWATVVLLGGFCSLLSRKDFWFSTVMIFMEGSRVFIRNDASVNQWLFGSTSAFRWEDFSFPRMEHGNRVAVLLGVGLAVAPEFRPEVASSILKLALLVILSLVLTRVREGYLALSIAALLVIASLGGALVYAFIQAGQQHKFIGSKHDILTLLKTLGLFAAWVLGMAIVITVSYAILSRLTFLRNHVPLLCFKIFIALALTCFPFLQAISVSHYREISVSLAIVLLVVSEADVWGETTDSSSVTSSEGNNISAAETSEQNNSSSGLLFSIVEAILPILFFWSVMFPLPGISLKLSFYMLFSVIAAVLIANLQIPVAFLQVLLSIMRLMSLLGHHHHDYTPLPPDASPNLVPSIVVFFILELCQGSSYILAVILGLFSFFCRRWLAHKLEFRQDWGPKAINMYFREAYQARTEKGLFRSDKVKYTPSLESFAIQSLGCTSSHELQTALSKEHRMQIVGLRILHNSLQRGDTKYNKKLITDIVKDAKNIITNIIGLVNCLTDEENSDDTQKEEKEDNMEVVPLSLTFVWALATYGGKISATFRKELSENPFFLDSLDHILNMEDCQVELLRMLVMDIIATMALDEAARKEIGSRQMIIDKLIHAFLRQVDENQSNDDRSLQMAAGAALANLTIESTICTDNCCYILLADPESPNLVKNLTDLLDKQYYMCVAANLLHNLCANSRDNMMDINFRANGHLESALLPKVMEMVRTTEGEELEAGLCVASQIGYVVPECFAKMLKSYITDKETAAELVEKLVNTLKVNREPCPEYPRIRRLLIEMVISIVENCPRYIEIFVEKGTKDALDMVKGTSSKFEKYRVFLRGEGVVAESLPMRDLINKAKRLINLETPSPCAQPVKP